MSNKLGYWFLKEQLPKNKFNSIQLVGKQKEKNWHFGISASSKLYPFHVLAISSHIYFTEDGIKVIESKSIQHSARRRQGKQWYNETWKEKMIAVIQFLSGNKTTFYLEVGSEEKIFVSSNPLEFNSAVSYNLPEKNTLEEEAELADINRLDNVDVEEEEAITNIETA